MGTHGALGFTGSKGHHECVERTMDGHMVCEVVDRWIKSGCPEVMLSANEVGNGGVQWGNERARDQVFFYLADHRTKTLWTNTFAIPEEYKEYDDEELVANLQGKIALTKSLDKIGWTLDWAWDCPEGSICNTPIPQHIPQVQHLKYQDEKKKKKKKK